MCLIQKYFPGLTDEQIDRFNKLEVLFKEWNEKVNLVSRKDIDNFKVSHILHSLSIAKFIDFKPGTKVMDLGCGGGLPGLPLAIMFPQVHFHLIDRIGKKVNAASDMAVKLGLKNVSFQHGDSGECREKFDFVVSRAVMPQKDLVKVIKNNIKGECSNDIGNGLIALKGGDLVKELKGLEKRSTVKDISDYFSEDFFTTKKIVYTKLV